MSDRLGPETKAIINAINGLKPNKENLNYQIITIDLAIARNAAAGNDEIPLPGWFDTIAVGKLTGAATIRLNERTKDAIDLAYLKKSVTPIKRLFVTNVAQPGREAILALGGDASFDAEPIRAGRKIFTYELLDEDGALNIFEANQAKVVLPTLWFNQGVDPPDMREGILQRIKIRLNCTAAVTYTFRLWDAAINGAVTPYLQEQACIYEMDFPGLDDVPYNIIMNRPFGLADEGALWYSIEWTGAPGNTMGDIKIQGELIR
jgi:hypothetical protein